MDTPASNTRTQARRRNEQPPVDDADPETDAMLQGLLSRGPTRSTAVAPPPAQTATPPASDVDEEVVEEDEDDDGEGEADEPAAPPAAPAAASGFMAALMGGSPVEKLLKAGIVLLIAYLVFLWFKSGTE